MALIDIARQSSRLYRLVMERIATAGATVALPTIVGRGRAGGPAWQVIALTCNRKHLEHFGFPVSLRYDLADPAADPAIRGLAEQPLPMPLFSQALPRHAVAHVAGL